MITPLRLTLVVLSLLLAACGPIGDANSSGSTNTTTTTTNSQAENTPSSDNTTADAATDASSEAGSDDAQTEAEQEQNAETEQTNFFYFSYDDSASTASYDLARYASEAGLTPKESWGRAYEFLNAEEFEHFESMTTGPFEISIGVMQHITQDGLYTYHYGVNLQGPTTNKATRKNAVLTLLIDVSGSMGSYYANSQSDEDGLMSLLEVVKLGLVALEGSLKEGDVVNLVTFSTSSTTVLSDWQMTDGFAALELAITNLETSGGTNLNRGIELAYQVANEHYDADKANRVIILTDAYANRGVVDVEVISNNTVINELEGIHFTGIGVGASFEEAFLNELTDAGRGSYFSMITPQDATRLFQEQFPALIDVAVEEVRFKLTYPDNLTHAVSAAEEVSQVQEEVQPTNFSYNTSQFFIESFTSEVEISDEQSFDLEIEYQWQDQETTTAVVSLPLSTLKARGEQQIMASLLVRSYAQLIAHQISCEEIEPYLALATDYPSVKVDRYTAWINQFCDF